MLPCYRFFTLIFSLGLAVSAFSAEWHKSYERGRDKIKAGDCSQGVSLMQEALRGNPKADPRAPTYGTMVIEYFPQYYLAVCAVQSGRLQDAQRYLKEAEGSRISSSRLAGEFQTLKARVDAAAQKQQKPADTKKPVQQPPPQQTPRVEPKPQPPPEKKPEPVQEPIRDNSAQIAAELRNARSALQNGRFEDARSSANRVLGMQPDNRDARRILSDVASRQATESEAREKQQKIAAVEQAIRRKDLNQAETLANALRSEYPTDSRVSQLLDQINSQRNTTAQDQQADELRKTIEREVLTAYYQGEYDQAIQLAKMNLGRVPQSWRLHFFLGCSYAALSLLEENDSDARLRLARDYFRRARSLSSSTSVPPYISPKIIEIYRSS